MNKYMRKGVIVVILLVMILSGGYVLVKMLMGQKSSNTQNENADQNSGADAISNTQSSNSVGNLQDATMSDEVKEIVEKAAYSNKISILNNEFSPAVIRIKVGGEVFWTNYDDNAHQVVADDDSFKTVLLGKGGDSSVSFVDKGVFTYHCSEVPGMSGTIIVE